MRIYLSSADVITPSCLEILSRVKNDTIPNVKLEFAQIAPGDSVPDRATVFAMGAYKRLGGERVVPAPSVAQTVTKADIVTRLGTAFRLLVDPPDLPEFDYHVFDDPMEADFFLDDIVDREVVVDIETSGDISVDEADHTRIISLAISGGGTAYVFSEDVCQAIYPSFCAFLERNKVITVNGKFDLKYFPDAKVNHFRDTQLAHYALFPAAGQHDLKNVTKKYFGFEDWDLPGKVHTKKATYEEEWHDEETGAWADARSYSSGSGYERIPRDMLYRYNAFDVYATWHWDRLMAEYLADDEDSRKVLDLLMRLSEMFMEVELRGIRLDIPYLEELSKTLTIEKAEAEAKLNEIAGADINPRSPKQVKEWFDAAGVKLKGTAEALLVKFIEEAEPGTPDNAVTFAEQLLVCRGISKQLGTYVDGYRNQADANGIVRPGYKLTASTTGRLGGQGASMLTIPRDKRLKKMVLPYEQGHVVVGADLSQAELRVMACESMDEWLIAAFQPGAQDFFDLLLTEAYPKQDWFSMHEAVGAHKATEAQANHYNNARAKMKGCVYGKSFGRGDAAIAASLKITIREASTLSNAFIRPGSMFSLWREEISERAVAGESIVTKFGRHFQSELVTAKNKQTVINSALSFTSQSTANDICLLAALNTTPQLPAFGAHMMGTVHDAEYVSSPHDEATGVGELLVRELEQAGKWVYGDLVPFAADWGFGKNMAEA